MMRQCPINPAGKGRYIALNRNIIPRRANSDPSFNRKSVTMLPRLDNDNSEVQRIKDMILCAFRLSSQEKSMEIKPEFHRKDLMTTGFRFAKHIHGLMGHDNKNTIECFSHGIVDDCLTENSLTKDCLIIESMRADNGLDLALHTPLGRWKICEDNQVDVDQLIKKIKDRTGLKMIDHNQVCGINTRWLITRFDEIKLSDSVADIYLCNNMNDVSKKFDHKLGQWLESGLLRDVDRVSQLMMLNINENSVTKIFPENWLWDIGMSWFKMLINDDEKWKQVIQGTENQQLFKAIYFSGRNCND